MAFSAIFLPLRFYKQNYRDMLLIPGRGVNTFFLDFITFIEALLCLKY